MAILELLHTEILLSLLIVLLLVLKLTDIRLSAEAFMHIAQAGLLVLLATGFLFSPGGQAFGDMFFTNNLIRLEKNILTLGTLIITLQSGSWIKNHPHAVEFYLLMFTALLGSFFLLSSGNLLMFYLGLEMSTLPVAALVNFDLDKKRSAEGAFKLIVTSAFASGLLLFGLSWLYGSTGTLSFAVLASGLAISPFTVFALMLVLAGIGFKISAVPFHLWTADVYEGAPMPVTAYLSVVSKAAVVFVLATLLHKVWGNLESYWYTALVMLAIFTMLAGNLFALRQQQIKRFLAFSSIAQVGFILVALCHAAAGSEAAVIYFLIIYLFSNLAAFGVVAAISMQTGKEMISDYTGLRQSNPALAWMLAIALFSLAGVPPMAGFFGKFFLLMAGAGKANWMLIVIAALNMIISMAYYLNIVRLMFMHKTAEPLPRLRLSTQTFISLSICMAGIMVTGLFSGAYHYIAKVVQLP